MSTERNKENSFSTTRRNLAEHFFDKVLISQIQARSKCEIIEPISSQEIIQWVKDFKKKHPGSGSDFDLSLVYGIALERELYYECLEKNDPASLPLEASDVLGSIILLERLFFDNK